MVENKEIIQSFYRIMPFLAQIFNDIVITLSDNEKYLFYKATDKLNHKIKAGDKIPSGSMTDRTLKKKGITSANIDAKVFGVAYTASGFPIFNLQGEIIGGMVFCESVEMQENKNQLKNISSEIAKNMALM